ncbi:MAG: type II secretion system major pseudopilin GspG [Methylococcales bacterium]|jgi:general secretion pathway protein G|nr:type II secretion system major pseudopilin GspG [Methylococcales bacterium]
MNIKNKTKQGFSLIELLVVLVILGLLGGVVGPKVMKYLGSSKSSAAKIQIEEFSAAMDLYQLEVGRYPNTLDALVNKPGDADRWNGPYLKKKKIPKDPWNNDYVYTFPGENLAFDLVSLGSDGVEGGEGENKDIVNWD